MIIEISTDTPIKWEATGYEKIVDNVANILKTRLGEVPYMRGMGISPEYIDSPISISRGQIINDAVNAISTYEPRVTIKEIDVVGVDENGDTTIKVVIEI